MPCSKKRDYVEENVRRDVSEEAGKISLIKEEYERKEREVEETEGCVDGRDGARGGKRDGTEGQRGKEGEVQVVR